MRFALERLNILGSVLMIGAHPDDENTALLAYFSRRRKVRTAYLSLTRGEGGQNLLGSEQSELLGIIRTQELLAARKIDGAEQYFTRAIDFGYTKSAEGTLAKWGREQVLADIVWNIRRFRPDVMVLIFSGTSSDGHGQHQGSAILGKEAFFAAADKTKFSEQLKWVEPWQAKRLFWNVYYWISDKERFVSKSSIEIDTGDFDPLLGYSYAEIAGISRSKHRSQGMGTPQQKGPSENYLVHVAGDPAAQDVFDGIDITWNRIPGGAEIERIISEAIVSFQPERPEETIPLLLKARLQMTAIEDPWAERKLAELDEAIVLCTGLWLDASADRHAAVAGISFQVDAVAINRSRYPMALENISLEGIPGAPSVKFDSAPLEYNQRRRHSFVVQVPPDHPYSQPYWLERPLQGGRYSVDDLKLLGLPESPPVLCARFRLRLDSQQIEFVRPVAYRYIDRLRGELVRPLVIVPPVAVNTSETILMFPNACAKDVEVLVANNLEKASGSLSLNVPEGWQVEPSRRPFRFSHAGEEAGLSFRITPPAGDAQGVARAVAALNGEEITSGMKVISYPHIITQVVFPPAQERLVRADVQVLINEVGYVMGAGDDMPAALRQLGCTVTLLSFQDLERGGLDRFDAIVTGVRAFNVRADLRSNFERLLRYIESGGTLIVQYNVLSRRESGSVLNRIGPYRLQIGRGRVSVEDAPVSLASPHHPLLESPNKITQEDFQGWVQERGLYFASKWDRHYQPLFESHDPGEKPLSGGTLFTRYGKGAYIFTAYSWFRQLPAGVPGAFRIFANFLSAAKTIQ